MERARKKIGSGGGSDFQPGKKWPRKKSPWAVCNLWKGCATIARPLGRNIGIISNCRKNSEKIFKKVVDIVSKVAYIESVS